MAPYYVVSLWDMLELPFGRLIHSFQQLSSTSQLLANWSPALGKPSFQNNAYKDNQPLFVSRDYDDLVEHAQVFCDLCTDLSLSVTKQAAEQVCQNLKRAKRDPQGNGWLFERGDRLKLQGSLNLVINCMRLEANTKVAMILPPDKLHLYSQIDPIFGSDVRSKYPSAIYDIDEAAKCLALGRSTAAVFHLMRVMEVALKAISKCLGLSTPNNPNWSNWLRPIRTEGERRNALPGKWIEFQDFQDWWQRIDAIKDAQRNQTMHVTIVYTAEEADIIFKATDGFIRKLPARMDENGLPLA